MASEENKMLVRRQIEDVWNNGNAGAIRTYWGDAVRGEIEHTYMMLRTAFPDLHITIDDLIAEGDRVAGRFTLTGTHQGTLQGVQPTGKRVAFGAMRIYRIQEAKVVETWAQQDLLGLLQQLDVVPKLE